MKVYLFIILLVLVIAPGRAVGSQAGEGGGSKDSSTAVSDSSTAAAGCPDLCAGIECGEHGTCSAGYCLCTDGYTTSNPARNCSQPPLTYSWTVSPYCTCSVTCGGGTQTRTVECLGSDGVLYDDSFCTSLKPLSQASCNTGSCDITFHWSTFAWSACSVTCGQGTQTRDIECVGSDSAIYQDSACQHAGSPPDTTQPCTQPPCVTITWSWVPGDWSECNATCGGGTQTRTITCVGSDQSIDQDGSNCADFAEPPSSRECNTDPCQVIITYEWTTTDWSICSVTCGEGVQTRTVQCKGSDGLAYADSYCNTSDPPAASQSCEMQPCYYTVIRPDYTGLTGGNPLPTSDASVLTSIQSLAVLCTLMMIGWLMVERAL